MKKIEREIIAVIFVALLTLTGVFLYSNSKSYAMPNEVPTITSFVPSELEDNALTVNINSNNTGDYSYELINITDGKTNNLGGLSSTKYTYQNLEEGKEYQIMIRACEKDAYSCTGWSDIKTGIAKRLNQEEEPNDNSESKTSVSVKEPTIVAIKGESTSIKLDYTVAEPITGVEIVNSTLNKTYKTTNKSTFTETGLKPSSSYNYKIRAYYKLNDQTYYSNYTVKTGLTKTIVVNAPTLSKVKSDSTDSIKLTYKIKGTATGVEIYNQTLNKKKRVTNKTTYTWKGLNPNKKYKFKIRSYYTVDNKVYYSNWSRSLSDTVATITSETKKKINSLKKRSGFTTLRVYSKSNMKKVATIQSGYSEKDPQGICYDGKRYIVQFKRHNSDSYGRVIAYSKSGKKGKVSSAMTLGHANGVTCDQTISNIYSVDRGGSKCTVIDRSSFNKKRTFNLPGGARSIGYDNSNQLFYISSSGKIRVLNKNFKQKKTIKMKRTSPHHQDLGAYHGLVLQVISITKHSNSYIDIYRVKDGAYLGSFKVSMGELESVFVDEKGYLFMLINIVGTSTDYIYRSSSKIPLP